MIGRTTRRLVGVALAALVLLLVGAGPAAADPPGPTDYRSVVMGLEPDPDGAVAARLIGGDSFFELTVAAGTDVTVLGYQGEPFVRFNPDGTVDRNDRSPSRWLNDDRFGNRPVPADATADAEPDWQPVAAGGTYAWHDHRAHWMSPSHPPGAEPGDVVLEAVIPLTVDGNQVEVVVRSVLLAPPSPVPAIVGVGLVAAGLAAAVLLIRRPWAVPALAAGCAFLALVVGAWAYLSVPRVTGPSLTLWVGPLVAVVALVVAAVLGEHGPRAQTARVACLLLGAYELVWWVWTRRTALSRSLIPSDAPAWLDRATLAAAGAAGVTVGLVAVLTVALRAARVGPAGPVSPSAGSASSARSPR
ncbi:MAG: hypothetical protein R2761_03110 [Acidimicrobiales bacterium]